MQKIKIWSLIIGRLPNWDTFGMEVIEIFKFGKHKQYWFKILDWVHKDMYSTIYDFEIDDTLKVLDTKQYNEKYKTNKSNTKESKDSKRLSKEA